MPYKIIILDKADEMLKRHTDFLAKVNKNAATKFVKNILSDIRTLSEFPQRYEIFTVIEEYEFRKKVYDHRYLIIYYIENKHVIIDEILDARQDNNKWFI